MGLLRFVILSLGVGLWPAMAAAQVAMEVHLGLQGTVRLEKWNLITVQVKNTGPPLAGTLGVRVWRGSELRHDLHVATFTQEVSLPYQSRKRLTFVVPITSITHPVEVFLHQKGRVLVQQRFNLRDVLNADHVILGVTPDPSLDFLATTYQRHTRIVYLHPRALPQRWSGYDSVSAVVLKGMSLQVMTDKQATALRQWIARGGTFVVAGDSQYGLLQEPRLRQLLPVQVLGVEQQQELPAFAERYDQPLPAATLLVVRSRLLIGQVLLGTDDAPLLAQRDFGRGRVVFLAVDYAAQPLEGWEGNRALWHDILQPAETIDFSRVFAELGLLDDAHPIVKLLRRPLLAYPSHLALSVFLLVYCGGFGLLFWRMGKPQARRGSYWLGVLLMICGGAVGAYEFFPERGLRRPAIVLDATTMEVLPETGFTHTLGYLGLFSPRGGHYRLTFRHPDTILRHTFHRGGGQAGEAIEVVATEPLTMRGITLDPWMLRVFSTENMAPAPLQVTAWRHTTGLTVQIKNHGALPLQGTVVVYRGKLFPLGAIAPGTELFEDLYTPLQLPETAYETTWQALFKRRPMGEDTGVTYSQEVLLQHYFGENQLVETDDTAFLAGWFMAPTTLQQALGEDMPVQGVTLVISRL
ncbi:hypothetical protein NKDENANG_00689 [Candidatus Entotheonellaceae bacterium PAL068K]